MPVLINFKICDNAKECGGIAVCPTKALSWDDKKKSIKIDNSKCINCKKCVPACMVGAIQVADNDKDYEKMKRDIDSDPRKVSDLFVDRYGASPISKIFLIGKDKFEIEVFQSCKMAVAEFFNDESIQCLFTSIPISDLLENKDVKYRKVKLDDDSLIKRFKVKQLPALLFFKNKKLVGKIEGYFDILKNREILTKINKILT